MLNALKALGLRQLARPAAWNACKAALHTEAAAAERVFTQQAWSQVSQQARSAAQHAAGLRGLLPRTPALPSKPPCRSFAAQPNLQEQAAQRLKSVATAVRSAPEALAKAPGAVYKALPGPARRLLDAAQTPGAVNKVISLHLESFWQHHGRKVLAAGGVVLCYLLWKALYASANLFVNMSETMASVGFFALAAAMVSFGFLYLRWRYRLDPQHVYRLAMMRLNTHPGLLEVMGAPLAGSEVRASVLTGGRIKFKGLRPKLQSRRLQMIFPLKGSERRGLVSLEAKKRQGHYSFKLLAVDVPAYAGGEQRIFIEGGPSLYERGGVINELRDPFIRALGMEEAFLQEDEADDEAEQRQREKERAARAAAKAAEGPKTLDKGGGMYFPERAWLAVQRLWRRINFQPVPRQQPLSSAPPPAVVPAARKQQ